MYRAEIKEETPSEMSNSKICVISTTLKSKPK